MKKRLDSALMPFLSIFIHRVTLPRMISLPSNIGFGDRLPNLSCASLPSFQVAGPSSGQHAAFGGGGARDCSQQAVAPCGAALVETGEPTTPLTPVSVDQHFGSDQKVEVVNQPTGNDVEDIAASQHDSTIEGSVLCIR